MENPALQESLGHVFAPRYVDPTFSERLSLLDLSLEPRWNPKKCRWEIWRKGKYIMTVQTNSGEFAPLDNRVLTRLWAIDTHTYANASQFIQSLHLEDEKLLGGKRKEQDEFVRACYRDMAPFLRARKSVVASKVREK